jgi:hypothetical protein
VRLGAHGCRSVHGSILGSDLAAKRRGGAGRGGAVQTVTDKGAGVRISPGLILRATSKTNWVQKHELDPLPIGSGPSWPRRSSGRRQWWWRIGFPRPGTNVCGCVQKPVVRRALNGHKDGASHLCCHVHEANLHADNHGGATSRETTSRRRASLQVE